MLARFQQGRTRIVVVIKHRVRHVYSNKHQHIEQQARCTGNLNNLFALPPLVRETRGKLQRKDKELLDRGAEAVVVVESGTVHMIEWGGVTRSSIADQAC